MNEFRKKREIGGWAEMRRNEAVKLSFWVIAAFFSSHSGSKEAEKMPIFCRGQVHSSLSVWSLKSDQAAIVSLNLSEVNLILFN